MARNPVSQLERFIPRGSPLAKAGGARMLLRVTGGNVAGAAALAAIARKESEFGRTSGRFVNNPYGWGVHLGPSVNTAPSIEEMSRRVWKGLNSGLYKGAGLVTAPDILNRYAPPSENNTALYKSQVAQWMREMGVNPQANIFQSGGVPLPADSGAGPSSLAPESLQAVAGQLDARRLMGILNAQRQRVLRGEMPSPGYAPELMKLAQQALPRAQVLRGSQAVGQQVEQAGTAAVGGLAPILPGNPGGGSFGYSDPEGQGGRHMAIDWFAKHGTPVAAPASGKVVRVSASKGTSGQVFGGVVSIRDQAGRLWVMRHIDPRGVRVGQRIQAGQTVGTPTAWQGGSHHIHLEAYRPGSSDREYSASRALNPYDLFRSAGVFR